MDDNNSAPTPLNTEGQENGSIQYDHSAYPTQSENPIFPTPESQSNGHLSPISASDTDLIEKEWVTLLENITIKYSEDPYTQQVEISKVKSDYIKKRYGKDIKQGGN